MEAAEVIAGRYRVERAIGRGGMGTVWLCTDEVLGRQVAVKQVGLLPGESAPDVARALREARSSAALNHPNVVSVFDAVEDEQGRSWLVMEHVDGSTLSQLVEREGRLEPRRVAAIGAQVAGGLAAAHARGTVHRDVKPSNVLIDGDTAKISDFGIARTEGDAQLTRTGLLIGTPLYFSPELARGDAPAPASDVWALGATLYSAVEGRPPVPDRGNPIATLTAIATASVPRPEHAGPLTPVLARMLDPEAGARCTMAEAAAELARLADEHPTRMLETPVAATAPLAAAGPVGAAAVLDPEPDPFPEPVPEPTPAPAVAAPMIAPREERGRRRTPVLVVALLLLLLGGVVAVALLPGEDEEPAADPGTGRDSTSPEPTAPSSAGEEPAEPEDPPATSQAPATTAPAGGEAPAGEAEQLVSDYYALLPDDTRTAWGFLGGEARSDAGGYGGYTGFWDTIGSVSVEGTSVEDGVVTVELVYDGSQRETRQLLVSEQGGDLLIADDLGPA